MKPFSLNEKVKVKILPPGMRMLEERFSLEHEVMKRIMRQFEPDSDGYTTLPMFLVCFYFGSAMRMNIKPEDYPIEMEILVR